MKRDKSVVWHRPDPAGLDLTGLHVAVIGGTGGIGRALSRFMASRGAQVLVVGQTFRDEGVRGIDFLRADLSLMSEAQQVAHRLPAETLDLVVFTTGILAAPKRQETAEGLERDMAVSYLSRFVILHGIAARLGQRRPTATMKPRVFVMGAPGRGQAGNPEDLNAEKAYGAMSAHMNTIAGNEMLVLDAAERYPHLNAYGLNPGLVKSNIRSNLMGGEGSLRYRLSESLVGLFMPSADTYAKRMTPLFASPDLEGRGAVMFDHKGNAFLPSPKLTDDHIHAFMTASEALLSRTGVRVAR
ncbi:SDR family NAD(P)-dependent oxidoreductase [Streptomyces sp. NPDC020951]|uniref:SDR family NAD(P)-dependent oxidoreductase n=1 Tax=Streptomyces sp. NPDC020951 TaxID=3365104 RepID=UPI003799CC75